MVSDLGKAGLALGAPARFWDLPVDLITQMNGTYIAGVMYTTHSVLNRSMWPAKRGTIINVSSVTGLECPPFDGEAVYHTNKACIEGFNNSLRIETAGSDIRVSALWPGCVVTNFHLQRVKYDEDAMDEFFYGYEPLVSKDLADAVWYMLSRFGKTSIKALDCVPTAQRSLISDRLSVRSPFIVGPCLITIAGIIINLVTTNMAAQYFSIFLTLSSSYACFQISNAWMANFASRPRKKRAVALALNTAMGNSAMTWTPYLYPESQGPRYITAWSVNLAVTTICAVFTIVLRWRLSAENRDLGQAELKFQKALTLLTKVMAQWNNRSIICPILQRYLGGKLIDSRSKI